VQAVEARSSVRERLRAAGVDAKLAPSTLHLCRRRGGGISLKDLSQPSMNQNLQPKAIYDLHAALAAVVSALLLL